MRLAFPKTVFFSQKYFFSLKIAKMSNSGKARGAWADGSGVGSVVRMSQRTNWDISNFLMFLQMEKMPLFPPNERYCDVFGSVRCDVVRYDGD